MSNNVVCIPFGNRQRAREATESNHDIGASSWHQASLPSPYLYVVCPVGSLDIDEPRVLEILDIVSSRTPSGKIIRLVDSVCMCVREREGGRGGG